MIKFNFLQYIRLVIVPKTNTGMKAIQSIISFITIFSCLQIFSRCDAASAHIRTHQHKSSSNERTEDGAFSPRDSDHYIDGEHHQEFDHEAILGNYL